MKTLTIAYKLFKKQLSSNIIIIIFLALLCSVSIYLYNQYDQRTACYSTFNNSDYNMLYVNVPSEFFFSPSISKYTELQNELYVQAKESDGYIGTSTSFEAYVKINKSKSEEERFSSIYMIDEITSKAIKYNLKKGSWLSESSTVNGMQPCIIGGNNSDKYSIGDVLNITFLKEINDNGMYTMEETESIKYYVSGIFNDKQQFFNISTQASTSPLPLSDYFRYAGDVDLYIWSEHDLTYSQAEKIMSYNINSAPVMYFDKSLSREMINEVIRDINAVNLFSHHDLMAEEKLQIVKDYEFILPTLAIWAIVSIVGIYSMCLLNVFENYKTYAIFYLCGCSKSKNIIIIAIYSSFFMIFTLALVGIIYCIFAYIIKIQDPYILQYIYLKFNHVAGIILLCFSVSLLSFITPFFLLRKMSVAKQLTVE